jgi:hypothetical protein
MAVGWQKRVSSSLPIARFLAEASAIKGQLIRKQNAHLFNIKFT